MTIRRCALVVALCLSVAVACGGGKSDAEKAKDGAALAKAGCGVFVNFKPPAGTDVQSQIDATKATFGAFLKSADLAGQAAEQDSRWKALQSAAEREAAAYEVLAKATGGSTQVDRGAVANAVKEARDARPLFLAECEKADPAHFSTTPTAPTPSPTPEKTHKR